MSRCASQTQVGIAVVVNDCWNRIGVRGDQSCPELQTHIHCRNCPVFTGSGRSLLDRSSTSDYRGELTELVAKEKEIVAKGTVALFGFRIANEWLALPTSLFIEMTELKVIRRIPYRANPIFKGMVNIRGELQLCMSLHKLLGFDEPTNLNKDEASKRRLAVTEKDRARWVFPVDEILGLVRCSPDELIKPPVTVSKAASPHVKFVLQKNDRQIGVLDEELTFYQLSRSVQ